MHWGLGSTRWAMGLVTCWLATAVLTSCRLPSAPDEPHAWRGVASLDSQSSPNQVKLYWYTTTSPGCIDPVCPPPGPDIARVDLFHSSVGPTWGYRRIQSRDRGGRDTTVVAGLTNGRMQWFRVVAYGRDGEKLIASNLVMTSAGPIWDPSTTTPLYAIGDFSWAPSGDRIAYVHNSSADHEDLSVLDLASLATSSIISGGSHGYPAWSLDGGTIAYTHSPSRTNYLSDYRIWLVSLADGSKRSITPGRVDWGAAWGGGGRRLYFLRGTIGPPNIPEIWRVDIDVPGSERAVTAGQTHYKMRPSVRPTDDRIVYEGSGATSKSLLYLLNPELGGSVPLTSGAWWDDSAPAWSSDGRQVVFISTASGHQEVWSIDVETKSMMQLTRGARGPAKMAARWSPDGGRLAVYEWGYPGRLLLYQADLPALASNGFSDP